jgi:Uncharacterized protein conserved in bacteria (DUF2184)
VDPKIYWNEKDPTTGKRLEVVLNADERFILDSLAPLYERAIKMGRVRNALGYERVITTLTTIVKKITEQKFYQVAPADYVPIRVGEGAWSSNLLTYREFVLSDNFEDGNLDTGADNTRLAKADAGVDSLSISVNNWGKSISWNIIDLEMAAKSGNWDIVTAKARARKRNWDLGIQKVAFLGLANNKNCLGLLNLEKDPDVGSQITVDTTTLTTPISQLGPTNLSSFLQVILNKYQTGQSGVTGNQSSAWPTHFVIPQSDYLGLATPTNPDFPLKSILQLMQETLQVMTGNKNFKILPSRYADGQVSGTNQQRYALYNYAEESLRMDIPVDYTSTLANSIDNFSFQNVGYGQYTGVKPYRPQEMYYLQFPT